MKWDNGTHNAYRYGEEGKCDIVETQHHPRQLPPDTTKLDFGVRVVRGELHLSTLVALVSVSRLLDVSSVILHC